MDAKSMSRQQSHRYNQPALFASQVHIVKEELGKNRIKCVIRSSKTTMELPPAIKHIDPKGDVNYNCENSASGKLVLGSQFRPNGFSDLIHDRTGFLWSRRNRSASDEKLRRKFRREPSQ